jgi:hypothetical protein
MAHRTFSGMAKATERLIAELSGATIDDDDTYRAYLTKVNSLLREHDALWANPADVAESRALKHRLNDAWHKATTD